MINLPTSVGMYRIYGHSASELPQSPHKRGDVPSPSRLDSIPLGISPQAWGCTEPGGQVCPGPGNLPTSVGMYRRRYSF